jgi:hypothetical protein
MISLAIMLLLRGVSPLFPVQLGCGFSTRFRLMVPI